MNPSSTIIKAHHTWFGDLFWEQFCEWAIRWRFQAFTYDEVQVDTGRSLLMIANHISWWDGFWPIVLNKRSLGKRYHVMMLESELKVRKFMTRGGAFSIDPKSRSVIETLTYTRELLEDPANMVLMYPQGMIQSLYDDRFVFEKGLNRVLGENRQLLLAAALLDYGAFSRPSFHYYLSTMDCTAETTYRDVQEAFKGHYERSVARQKEKMIRLHGR